jgi:hypothetical protein
LLPIICNADEPKPDSFDRFNDYNKSRYQAFVENKKKVPFTAPAS